MSPEDLPYRPCVGVMLINPGGLTDAECDTLLDIITSVRERGTTIVWIEHVIRALRRVAGTIAVLHDGRFIATGAPDEVLVDRRVKDVYLGAGE